MNQKQVSTILMLSIVMAYIFSTFGKVTDMVSGAISLGTLAIFMILARFYYAKKISDM